MNDPVNRLKDLLSELSRYFGPEGTISKDTDLFLLFNEVNSGLNKLEELQEKAHKYDNLTY